MFSVVLFDLISAELDRPSSFIRIFNSRALYEEERMCAPPLWIDIIATENSLNVALGYDNPS